MQHAESNLNVPEDSAEMSKEDKLIRGRIRYGLRLLGEYAKALKQVRASGVIDLKNFKSGM